VADADFWQGENLIHFAAFKKLNQAAINIWRPVVLIEKMIIIEHGGNLLIPPYLKTAALIFKTAVWVAIFEHNKLICPR